MRFIFRILILSIAICSFLSSTAQKSKKELNVSEKKTKAKANDKDLNFFIISDWGWNGYGHQQTLGDQMALQADSLDPKFIVSCGDNFQVTGVASTQDPLWMSTFENVYKKPSLHVEWFPVFGNHDYKGNTQAQIDYSKISRRWRFESHYYSFTKKINDSISALFIFLDTPPLVNEYYKKPGYPDVFKQDTAQQMKWLKETLSNSKEQWKLIFGHHPIYSASPKHGDTQEMIERVKPLMEKYNAEIYFCGHDHDLQHSREKNGKIDYIVTGAGGEKRPNGSNERTVFSKSEAGFTSVSFVGDSLKVSFIGINGQTIYSFSRTRK